MISNKKLAVAAFVGTLALAALLFLISPFFHIGTVIIEGTSTVSVREVTERLEIQRDTNLLFFNTRAARRRVMENLYIGDVEFRRGFPDRLYVDVRERRLAAYVQHTPGSFLFLDYFGRVLEVRSYFTQPLPILEGLQFTRFQLGEILEVPDPVAFSAVVQYAQFLYQHGLIDRVTHMNVTDASNIRILVDGRMEFNVGNAVRADEKIRTIIEVLEQMPNPEVISGFMCLREIRSEFVFVVLQ
ncbi:MAG: FtsQ-type POTRA domain-containing protein [Defluviitaleaceae bacterium]|nr:FtsQ-type POTRA domain-containing protein [Defluviitaleaceae bacterium]